MYKELEKINTRPAPFECYTAADLWTDDHTSAQMLAYHLNGDVDISSRNTAFIDRSVAWIISQFGVGTQTSIADFGCGPGLYATRLARAGAMVTGIDFSPRSIGYARDIAEKEGLPVTYVNQNYLDYQTDERYDLIIMIMCDFCVLSPAQRTTLLAKFQDFLKPGGSILLDVYSLHAFAQRGEYAGYEPEFLNGFWSPHKYYGLLNTFKYEREKVVLDKYTIVEADRTRTVYNWLQYFTPEDLERELTSGGFSVDALYANVAGDAFDPDGDEFAVVARKH